ncbi:MAG: Ig-like domain-containing protein, partial [Longimicrobiales bacterium]
MSKRAVRTGVAVGIVAFAFACTIRDVTEVPVGSVVVLPSSVTLLEGETRQFTAQAKDGLGRNLPSGAVTWSSDAPSVFTVDGNGNGEALAVGQTTVWASLDGTLGSATVMVEPGPRIVADQASLLFFGNVGGEAPDPIPVQITNGGGGSLGGISATVQYAEGEVTGWLSLALAGTSAPTTLTVSVLIGLLDEGTYDAELILVSQEARNAPFSIPVQVVVTLDQPIIGLNPRTLQFQGESGGDSPPAQTVQINNLGGGVLSGLQASALYFGVGGWLSTNLAGVTAPTGLLIQPDPSDLSPGTYNAEVRVTGPGALNTPQSVLVTLTVTEAQDADAEVQKTGPDVGSTGDLLVYVLTVSSAGPGTARDVVLVDSLPAGVDFVDASGEGAHAAGVVTWNLGNLPPGTSSVDTVRARATATGSRTNVARITSSSYDPQEENDRAAHETTISGPDLAVTKNAPSSAAAGDRITYTLLARNLGPVDAEGVLLTDTLPPGVTFVSAT